ncbi:hypothetical protein OG883_03790 [Streptomyces sp. NBC_01142]|uniref:hypothetical protein n=1 Tax=Streptomyces sp. NBC_01142 TaxID=2975865 RepID=UPI00224F56A0|nr:hypothetical protein [Streptomyces sp. NBC_01142]MCX4819039.1 hypothetical protein [Streptomyces sp. NBC_01142]
MSLDSDLAQPFDSAPAPDRMAEDVHKAAKSVVERNDSKHDEPQEVLDSVGEVTHRLGGVELGD